MKWGSGDPDKVRPEYGSADLSYLELVSNVPKNVRIVGDPKLWKVHWVSIFSLDGEKKIKQPICCAKFDPEDLSMDLKADCILCNTELPDGCSYDREWDKGPDFRGFTLVVDRESQKKAGETYVKVYSFPVTIYENVERFAKTWGSPADPVKGYDVTITKIEKDKRFSYSIIPMRETTPLTEQEQEEIDKFETTFNDLYKLRSNEEIMSRITEIREPKSSDNFFSKDNAQKESPPDKSEPDKSQKTEKKTTESSKPKVNEEVDLDKIFDELDV